MTRKIVFLMFFVILSGALFGQNGIIDEDGFGFERSTGRSSFSRTAIISSYNGTIPAGQISIPNTLGIFPVTMIGADAFRNKGITEITQFPEMLQEIRRNAFANNGLETLAFPASVVIVGPMAFAGNPVTKITIGSGVDLDITAFDNRFGVSYMANGRQAGTYVFREGQWHTEQEWVQLAELRRLEEAEQERQANARRQREENDRGRSVQVQEERRQREENNRRGRVQEERRQRNPIFQIGFQFEDIFKMENEMVSNTITLRPWASLRLGNYASLKASFNFIFPWDELNGQQDRIFEVGESMLFMGSGDNWLKLGRLNYSDPLNLIANGLFDGIQISHSSLNIGAFYTGLRNKKFANIILSPEDWYDDEDDDITMAPSRVIASAQFNLLKTHNGRLLVGGLAQFDMRETSLPVDSYYAFAKLHLQGNSISIDGGAAVSFFKKANDPYKLGVAASAGINRSVGDFNWTMGLQWFSGNINNDITTFVPITRNYTPNHWGWILDSNANYPSLWMPGFSFKYSVDDAASLSFNSRWIIRDGFTNFDDISDYSEWKIDIGLTVSPLSSSNRRKPMIEFYVPVTFGLYSHLINPNGFSTGVTTQFGLEIELGSFMAFAVLAEAGVGFTLIRPDFENNLGAIGEVYFANKRLGLSMGYGRYRNITALAEDAGGLDYTQYGFIFRREDVKTTVYARNYSNNTWGFGILFSGIGDLLEL